MNIHYTKQISLSIFVFLIILSGCSARKKTPSNYQPIKNFSSRSGSFAKRTHEKDIPVPPELYKNLKEMTFDELWRSKEYVISIDDKNSAIKFIERMLTLSSEPNQLRDLRLELADLYFDQSNMVLAGTLYKLYITLYPGSDHREYAEYKLILCSFYETLDTDRDQSKTKETLIMAQSYLSKKETYTHYVADVQDIVRKCATKLLEHEQGIFNFYINKGNYKAAEQRLDHMKGQFLTLLKEQEPLILVMECQLAESQGHHAYAQQKKRDLQTRFPQYAASIANKKWKKDYVARF